MIYSKKDLFIGLIFLSQPYEYEIIGLGDRVSFINIKNKTRFDYPYDDVLRTINSDSKFSWKVLNTKLINYEIY